MRKRVWGDGGQDCQGELGGVSNKSRSKHDGDGDGLEDFCCLVGLANRLGESGAHREVSKAIVVHRD